MTKKKECHISLAALTCGSLCSETQAAVQTHLFFGPSGKLWLEVMVAEIHEHPTAEFSTAEFWITQHRHPAVTLWDASHTYPNPHPRRLELLLQN